MTNPKIKLCFQNLRLENRDPVTAPVTTPVKTSAKQVEQIHDLSHQKSQVDEQPQRLGSSITGSSCNQRNEDC